MTDKPYCINCVFYRINVTSPIGAGECRRHPPVMAGSTRRWPMVNKEDWCGEFKPIPPEAEEVDLLEKVVRVSCLLMWVVLAVATGIYVS